MSGAVVLPDEQIQRADAGDDVEVAVAIDVVGDHADELRARGAIDRRGEPGRQRDVPDGSGVSAPSSVERGSPPVRGGAGRRATQQHDRAEHDDRTDRGARCIIGRALPPRAAPRLAASRWRACTPWSPSTLPTTTDMPAKAESDGAASVRPTCTPPSSASRGLIT